jgi:hypothetical protein
MNTLAIEKEQLEERLKQLEEGIKAIDDKQAGIVNDLTTRGCRLNIEYMSLFDGDEEVLVYIMVHKNAVIMASGDVIAEAKCHPNDEFNLMVGYALCRNRLVEQLLRKKYNL